jgi:hypothetical protein
LKGASAADIAKTSAQGMATPDDGLFQALLVARGQAGAIVSSAVSDAHDTVQATIAEMERAGSWVLLIAAAAFAIFVLPHMLDDEPAPRKRRAIAP